MKFSTAFLDEIRARRARVRRWPERASSCARKGANGAGLSPFNAERTPSFFVNDQKGFYHDFSSGKHGDVFTFLIETEGLALSRSGRAARRDGRRADADAQRARARSATRSAPSLHDVLALAAQIFESTLHEPVGAKARGYLADRRIDPATQRQFGLGYAAPDRFALARRARRRAASTAEQMIEAGLLDPRRGHRRALRPFSRPRDVPDPRPLGPRRRFRRHGPWSPAPRPNTSILRKPSFSTRAACFSTIIARAKPPTSATRSSSSKAMST